jgi:hypothetical protein
MLTDIDPIYREIAAALERIGQELALGAAPRPPAASVPPVEPAPSRPAPVVRRQPQG